MLEEMFGPVPSKKKVKKSNVYSNSNGKQNQNNQLSLDSMDIDNNNSRWDSSKAWVLDLKTRQSKNMTPEIQARIKKKARRQKRIGKKCKRAKVYQKAAFLSKNAWAQGNIRSVNSAPMEMLQAADVSRQQMRSIQSVYRNNEAWNDDADDEGANALENDLAILENVQDHDKIQVDDKSMAAVLNQLKKEPKEEKLVKAKFELYEDFLKTVEDSRKATYDFWKDCKTDFDEHSGNVVKQVENELGKVDDHENLGIIFHEHRWFVYDMMVKADSNNDKLKDVLKSIERKLELLQKDDECPFCLEEGKKSVTLGCCHKACEECWTHWQELQGARAFCPLCRQEDFLTEVMDM